MRAYVLNHADEVLAQHLKIEARIAEGNPPEVREAAKRTHDLLMQFKAWSAARIQPAEAEKAARCAVETSTANEAGRLPSFLQWLADQKSQTAEGP